MRMSNNPTARNDRRIAALDRLERSFVTKEQDPIVYARVESDKKILRSRIVPPEVARGSRSKIYRGVK